MRRRRRSRVLLENIPASYPHFGPIVSLFVEPQDFYRYLNATLAPTFYTCEETLHETLSDTTVRRATRAFFSADGLRAELEHNLHELRARSDELRIANARAERRAEQLRRVEAFGRALARQGDVDTLADRLESLLCNELGCSDAVVWFFATPDDDVAPVRSRRSTGAELARIDLELDGRAVGRLEVACSSPEGLETVQELAPWIAIAFERARSKAELRVQGARLDAARDPTTRVEHLRGAWSLTPRQAEVLGCVVAGRANKEIADELGCALRTVEVHVTQILRKAGVDSRASLIALVWSDADDRSPRA